MNSGKIFISYRREDSSGESGRLKDKLEQVFGQENIFYDVETLEAGINFDQSISKALNESKILLAMIGPHWLKVTDEKGNPRIHNEGDWVKKEISLALSRNIRVIPILVNGAKMPEASELPEELQELSLKHAQELSSSRWNYDVGELVKVLEKIIPARITEKAKSPQPILPKPQPKSWWAKNYLWVLGSVIGIFILLALIPSQEVPYDDPYYLEEDSTATDQPEESNEENSEISANGNLGTNSSVDPRVTNPDGNEIYNSLTFEAQVPEFEGKWWLYENGIRSGFFQIEQNGTEFSFGYYLFNVPVGSGKGHFENGYLVSDSFLMNDSPGTYGFSFFTQDDGTNWIGQTFANQQVSEAYLIKN